MKSIRAVTLDVGGTLIEPWPSVGHVYAEVARSLGGPNVDPGQLSKAFGHAWKSRQGFDYSPTAWRNLVAQTFADVRDFVMPKGCFDAIYERFAQADAWRIFDDVRPFLESARRRGMGLAVVSNWDERLRGLMKQLDLLASFEAIIVSHEVGHRKPGHEIFRHAADQLGLPPGEILHVGDSEREDFDGARRAGWQARWLQRTGEPGAGAIRSLADITFAFASD
jgi:putative hydrolase of the HAD superfamily